MTRRLPFARRIALLRPARNKRGAAMFPKPVASLTPNTYDFETKPLVKPTGFREYDARWWFGIPGATGAAGAQPPRGDRARHGFRHAPRRARRAPRGGHRPRLSRLFLRDQDGARHRPRRLGLQGPRHRPRDDADGLFRPVRPRRAGGRHGHRLPQRERLDRRQDGLAAADHLRPRGDGPAPRDRARGARSISRAAATTCSSRISRRATSPT